MGTRVILVTACDRLLQTALTTELPYAFARLTIHNIRAHNGVTTNFTHLPSVDGHAEVTLSWRQVSVTRLKLDT